MVVGSHSPEPHSPVHRISRAFQVENVGWRIFKCGLKNNKEYHLFSSTAKGCCQLRCPGHCDKCQYTQLKSRSKRRRQSLYTSQVQTNPQGLIVPHVFAEVLKTHSSCFLRTLWVYSISSTFINFQDFLQTLKSELSGTDDGQPNSVINEMICLCNTSPIKHDRSTSGQVFRWPLASSGEGLRWRRCRGRPQMKGTQRRWRNSPPPPSQGSSLSDPHSQITATGAQIRDAKCFFPALSPDYSW